MDSVKLITDLLHVGLVSEQYILRTVGHVIDEASMDGIKVAYANKQDSHYLILEALAQADADLLNQAVECSDLPVLGRYVGVFRG